MSSAIKCDRCGYTSVNVTEFRHIKIYEMYEPTKFLANSIDRFDICNKCYDGIFDFRNSNEGGEDIELRLRLYPRR